MVEFNFLKEAPLKNRKQLKVFLHELSSAEKKELEDLSVVFCSDDYLLQVNRDYLGHDYYTDIITFDYSSSTNLLSGELYISIDRVKENAVIFESGFERELHRVIFHGLLHLLGYSDKTPKAKKLMREKEDYYLDLYFERST